MTTPKATDAGPKWKPRIWAMECPFRKSGSPVLGTFGAADNSAASKYFSYIDLLHTF